MGAFEFEVKPRACLPSGYTGQIVRAEHTVIGNNDLYRLMQICELVKRLEDALTVCSYIRPESEFTEMVNDAAKLLKGAHE